MTNKRMLVQVAEMAFKLVKSIGDDEVEVSGLFAYITKRDDIHGIEQEFVTAGLVEEDGYHRDIVWEEDDAILGGGPRIIGTSDSERIRRLHKILVQVTAAL